MNRYLLLISSLLFITGGCENPPENNWLGSGEFQALSDGLVSDLNLSKSSINNLNDILKRHGGRKGKHEPGFLWRIAYELQGSLSAEEKNILFARLNQNQTNFFSFRRGFNKDNRGRGPEGAILKAVRSVLSADQIVLFNDILKDHFQKIEGIKDRVQMETLTRKEARDQIKILRKVLIIEIEAMLSAEQKAKLEELKANRKFEGKDSKGREAFSAENKAVMYEIINLSSEEIEVFETIHEETKNAMIALKSQFRAGDINKNTFAEITESIFANHNDKLAELLPEAEFEIIKIHKALQIRMKIHQEQQRMKHDKG